MKNMKYFGYLEGGCNTVLLIKFKRGNESRTFFASTDMLPGAFTGSKDMFSGPLGKPETEPKPAEFISLKYKLTSIDISVIRHSETAIKNYQG